MKKECFFKGNVFGKIKSIATDIYTESYEKIKKEYSNSIMYESLWGNGEKILEVGNIEESKKINSVASISKFFTFLAFCHAEKNGKISLNSKISDFLPKLKLYYEDVNYASKISIEMLLRHTSGLPQFAKKGNIISFSNSLNEHIMSLNDMYLLYKPGNDMCYSNLNYDILGYILEKIYNTSFEKLMGRNVFDRLGITDYTYSLENKSQNPSIGLCISADSIMKTISEIFFKKKNKFFSKIIAENYMKYEAIFKNQMSGQGLCCKIFKLNNNHALGCMSGQFMGEYFYISWFEKLKICNITIMKKIKNKQIERFHKIDPFCETIRDIFGINETSLAVETNNFCIFSKKNERYVSCDNQIIEIVNLDNRSILYKNGIYEGNILKLYENTYMCNEHLIKKKHTSKKKLIIILSAGENRKYYFENCEIEPLIKKMKICKYNVLLRNHASISEEVNAKILGRLQDVYIAFNDKYLILNGKITFKKVNNVYRSIGGAVAKVDNDLIYINNLRLRQSLEVKSFNRVIKMGRI